LTIILITHEIHVIKEICDSVAVIRNGQIVECGPVVQLFANPQTEIAREFIRTATHDTIPENLQALIHSNPGEGNLVRIFFQGDVEKEPVIASLIRRFNLDVNILYAKLDFIQDTPFGSLIVDIGGTDDNVRAAMDFLEEQGCRIEVLNGVESTTLQSAD